MLERSASFFKNSGSKLETAIWTAKLMLLLIGVVSTFLLFKVTLLPCIFQSIVPKFLICVRACLAPPYIYIIVNFIIISIVVSSSSSSSADKSTSEGNYLEENNFVEIEEVTSSKDAFEYSENIPPQAEDEEEEDSYDDSLDGTWKTILEGKGTVKKPFLTKSDTWNTTRAPPTFSLAKRVSNDENHQKHEMRKSETFNDRVSTLKAGGGIRPERLLTSQDSLNARVEAFINKFQNDMRMERQQSDMRYINMVKQQAAGT